MYRRLRLPLALLALAMVAGVLGYRVIEGWSWLDSLWMVVITFTSIGYGEVHPLSPSGRVFTLALIIGGLSIVSYTVTQLTQAALEGDLMREWREARRRRLVDGLKDHFVVAGYGRIGREVAEELAHAGQAVVVIDTAFDSLDDVEHDGIVAIVGDAGSDDVLRRAGILRAKGLAVATPSGATNILVTLSARKLNPNLRIMTRVERDDLAQKAIHAGADGVLNPYSTGGTQMAHGLVKPHVRSFLELALARSYEDLGIEDITIGVGGQCLGSIGSLGLRDRCKILIVAVRKVSGPLITVPGPEVALEVGDVAVVMGDPRDIEVFRLLASPRT